MGKKEKHSDIYEKEQANKKHRKRSKKLEKRENIRKNKKKNKKEKNEKRKMIKYVKKVFKENKEDIETTRLFDLCLDLDEIVKQIKKMYELNKEAVTEIPSLFKTMEDEKKEVNLGGIEDKQVQKYLIKLMKNLKINQSPKNPYSFRITNLNKKRDPKMRYTSDTTDILPECLSSYYFLVKSLFEYVNYAMNSKEGEEGLEINKNSEDEDDDDNMEDESENEKNPTSQNQKMKELEKQKYEMDCEYELLEEKLGKNSELINKAFNKIMQEDCKADNLNNNKINEEEEEELVGPPVPKFLESTLNMLNENNEGNDMDSFNNLLNKTSYSKTNNIKNSKLPTTAPKSKIEPINKESYDRLIAYERERTKYLSEELEDYESKYRHTSLLEEHQSKTKKEKNLHDPNDEITRTFDRERDMNIGRIDSKRALAIMRDQKGLQGRFEAKEKYIGY